MSVRAFSATGWIPPTQVVLSSWYDDDDDDNDNDDDDLAVSFQATTTDYDY